MAPTYHHIQSQLGEKSREEEMSPASLPQGNIEIIVCVEFCFIPVTNLFPNRFQDRFSDAFPNCWARRLHWCRRMLQPSARARRKPPVYMKGSNSFSVMKSKFILLPGKARYICLEGWKFQLRTQCLTSAFLAMKNKDKY